MQPLHEAEAHHKVEQGAFDILEDWVFGMVMFCAPTWTTDELRKAHGGEIDLSRIPRYRPNDPELSKRDKRLVPGAPWPVMLLEGALVFAKNRIVLVCPTGYEVPQHIVEIAVSRRIEIDRVPLSRFTADECRKLQSNMSIWGPHKIPENMDRNDPEHRRRVYERFKDAVVAFW
jgi:hypothetical protein